MSKAVNNFSEVVPKNGTINIDKRGLFHISIPVEPFILEESEENEREEVVSQVELGFTEILNVYSLKELENKTFEFPVNPALGYVDGSFYLGNVHNPADLIKLEFGLINMDYIEATVHIIFDFTFEGPEHLGKNLVIWNIKLSLLISD
jgi:hypothetical protein